VIFVDSSYFIAEVLRRDGRHRDAASLASRHASDNLTTTNLVLAETWTFVRRRADHRLAIRWLDRVLGARRIVVVRVDEELEADAWAWLRIHDERPYSFVDATSFALMRRKRIADALAFDGDFAAAGFNELRP
jgi:predicted nucleic acid-binding protein